MNNNIVKKQHFIPRFYLRRFSQIKNPHNDKKNKILVFDKKNKKIYGSSVQEIAQEKFFYDIDNADTVQEKQIFEHAFSELETEFSIFIKKLINRCQQQENLYTSLIANKNEREYFSFYIVLQLLRTQKYRKKTYSDAIKLTNELLFFSSINYKLKSNAKIIDFNNIDLILDEKKLHLKTLLDHEFIDELNCFIANSCWIFIQNKSKIPFVISDNPVCRIPRTFDSLNFYYNKNYEIHTKEESTISGFISPLLEIHFPLSQTTALKIIADGVPNYLEFKKYKNKLIPIENDSHIHSLNQFQIHMAHEKVFINPDYKYLTEQYFKPNHTPNVNLMF